MTRNNPPNASDHRPPLLALAAFAVVYTVVHLAPVPTLYYLPREHAWTWHPLVGAIAMGWYWRVGLSAIGGLLTGAAARFALASGGGHSAGRRQHVVGWVCLAVFVACLVVFALVS